MWIPPMERADGWDISGVGARAAQGTHRTTHKKGDSHPTPHNPWQAPLVSHGTGKRALENFFGVFYQGGEMHLHPHPPTTDCPSRLGANSPLLTLILITVKSPRTLGKAKPEVQIKEGVQAGSARPER